MTTAWSTSVTWGFDEEISYVGTCTLPVTPVYLVINDENEQ